MAAPVTFDELFTLEPAGDDTFRAISAEYPWGQVYGGQVAAQGLLAETGTRHFVLLSSILGRFGVPWYTGYCTSKTALLGLTRALAMALADQDIQVNALCPGFLDTEMTDRSITNIMEKTGKSRDEAIAALAATNPQKRLIQPSEVTAAALWLCGAGSEGINGQAIPIAGGEV